MYKNREPYFIFPVISIKHLQQSLVNNSLMGGRVSFECHGQKSILQITEFQVCIWALYYNLEYQKIKMSRQCNLMNHAQHIWVCVCVFECNGKCLSCRYISVHNFSPSRVTSSWITHAFPIYFASSSLQLADYISGKTARVSAEPIKN